MEFVHSTVSLLIREILFPFVDRSATPSNSELEDYSDNEGTQEAT